MFLGIALTSLFQSELGPAVDFMGKYVDMMSNRPSAVAKLYAQIAPHLRGSLRKLGLVQQREECHVSRDVYSVLNQFLTKLDF